jgi:hypothetical protein
MNLVSDVLDKPVLDRHGHSMGRVDGLLLELRDGRPPIVRAIEIGPDVLAYRLYPALGRLAALVQQLLGLSTDRPLRVPFTLVQQTGLTINADLAAGDTGTGNVEHSLRAALRRWTWK